MHDVVIVGIPLTAILFGILFGRSDAKEIRAELKDLRGEMQSRFSKVEDHLGRIDADLRQFYHLTGKLVGRIEALEKRA